MKWILCIVVLFLCVISGLLGLTAGINFNPDSTIKFIPAWGSLGDWVSGLGALLAVLVTLWLADKQRREDAEILTVVSNASFPVGPGYIGRPFISLELTSEGKRPVTAVAVGVTSVHSTMSLAITGFSQTSPVQNLPVRLEYGQRASIHLQPGAEIEIARYVDDHCGGRVDGLTFLISTTTGSWKGALSQNLLTIRQMAEQLQTAN
ncbi:hypothetical protein HX871_06920 [Pseudomonas reactans]|uniref:Uncharacterized protein n=1 Tax=Pseudomonas reactans TaxID=117680 RepID=A0ABX2QUW1_9PSED|nr:hypothetical protein [Pseudomonas reactans]NWA43805.1 hypothetical protein [Pseudomonas reactans]NWD94141.1 hypothetical protein [Pseudomonas reactans]NWF12174.1 hypothetical protein [Pseudomonas reactans]